MSRSLDILYRSFSSTIIKRLFRPSPGSFPWERQTLPILSKIIRPCSAAPGRFGKVPQDLPSPNPPPPRIRVPRESSPELHFPRLSHGDRLPERERDNASHPCHSLRLAHERPSGPVVVVHTCCGKLWKVPATTVRVALGFLSWPLTYHFGLWWISRGALGLPSHQIKNTLQKPPPKAKQAPIGLLKRPSASVAEGRGVSWASPPHTPFQGPPSRRILKFSRPTITAASDRTRCHARSRGALGLACPKLERKEVWRAPRPVKN